MTKKMPANYRLKIDRSQPGHRGGITYIVRNSGRVVYMGADETPLALSNLIMDDAASMRFALEDATDGDDAAQAIRTVLADQWKNNKPLCPKVEVLP